MADEVNNEEGEIENGEEQPQSDTPQMIRIGDKEFTVDQVAEFAKKAEGYDALLPDYTKKAQRLSELEKGQETSKDLAPYEREGWVPKDYKELAQAIQYAEKRGMEKAVAHLESKAQERAKVQQQAKQELDSFVESTKSKDKTFDEQDFFEYVTRHKFKVNDTADLQSAYSSYKELAKSGSEGKEKVITKVNKKPSSGEANIDLTDTRSPRMSLADAAFEAFHRLKGS